MQRDLSSAKGRFDGAPRAFSVILLNKLAASKDEKHKRGAKLKEKNLGVAHVFGTQAVTIMDLKSRLECRGFEKVLWSKNREELLSGIEDGNSSLLLVDLSTEHELRQVELKTAVEVRQQHNIPVIALSSSQSSAKCSLVDADFISLSKPFDDDAFEEAMNTAVLGFKPASPQSRESIDSP